MALSAKRWQKEVGCGIKSRWVAPRGERLYRGIKYRENILGIDWDISQHSNAPRDGM